MQHIRGFEVDDCPDAGPLLENIIYGNEGHEIRKSETPDGRRLADEHAKDFIFKENVSAQMAAAFLFFWNQ